MRSQLGTLRRFWLLLPHSLQTFSEHHTGLSLANFGGYDAFVKYISPYFYASLKVAITLAFVGTTVSEMTAANEGIGYLLISAGSSMQMGLAFAGLLVVGAMAMAMYELFAVLEKRTTAWAHRGSQNG